VAGVDDEKPMATQLVRLIWKHYADHARWPTTRDLDRLVDRVLHGDLKELVDVIPQGLMWPDLARWRTSWIPNDSTEITLTVGGFALIPEGSKYTSFFVTVLKYLVDRADSFEPQGPAAELVLADQDVADALGVNVDDERMRIAGVLLKADAPGLWRGFGGGVGERWTITLDERGARAYRGIDTAGEFVQRLRERRDEENAAMRRMTAAAIALVEPEGGGGASDVDGDPRKVFVVHGRNLKARDALYEFLGALGLHPVDFEKDAVAGTGDAAPYTGDVLSAGFDQARAVIVLFTPDERVSLRAGLASAPWEYAERLQSRANVYFEAGMAFVSHPRRTVLVELGQVRVPSDIEGRHVVRLDDSPSRREALLNRLKIAGCEITDGTDWLSAGHFAEAIEGDDCDAQRG
jgi:predicted nucleotide-binding protein